MCWLTYLNLKKCDALQNVCCVLNCSTANANFHLKLTTDQRLHGAAKTFEQVEGIHSIQSERIAIKGVDKHDVRKHMVNTELKYVLNKCRSVRTFACCMKLISRPMLIVMK